MKEGQVAQVICDEFETQAASFYWTAFQEQSSDQASLITYYQAAIHVVTRKPFRNDLVQKKVLEFLDKRLTETCEELLREPLKLIRSQLHLFEEGEE